MHQLYSTIICCLLAVYSTTFSDDHRAANYFNEHEERLSRDKRAAPFNALVGTASTNVPAYSNGDESYFSGQDHYLYGVYMGVKWQCVEYARRWLFIRKGCTFGDVDSANDMWYDLQSVERVVDGRQFPIRRYSNGSPTAPKAETLIIYQQNGQLPFGHVAVIVEVGSNYIRIAEQNYYYNYWSGNYARQIPVSFRNGRYHIDDQFHIYGWMEVQDSENQLKPFDSETIRTDQ